ncbi:MAG: S8 family peptidase [Bdellovibrionota bacterium]
MKKIILSVVLLAASAAFASQNNVKANEEFLVKFTQEGMKVKAQLMNSFSDAGSSIEQLPLEQWILVKAQSKEQANAINSLKSQKNIIAHVQPNYKLYAANRFQNKAAAKALNKAPSQFQPQQEFPGMDAPKPDNPEIPAAQPVSGSGADPEFSKQWGMVDNNVKDGWSKAKGDNVIVAVIDTGVDYEHEDLLPNLWRNSKEIAGNNIDDDNNGYIDDLVGWDFVSNDNKPYDFKTDLITMLTSGGNPGHGTHCAGNVAARGDNGKGIGGVAPNAKIMILRFLSEKGSGTTADAVKAVKYAVDNGAKVLSNSWGSSGEDPNDAAGNQALRDIVQYSMDKGTLFVAAAGNGDQQGKGYDNDTNSAPAYPASYTHENIISVAALDANNALGTFSNWGAKSVDIGAPGVKVFSTISGGGYSDTVADLSFLGMGVVTWDGTSMATPHVAGAAALYWSKNPTATWKDVKNALMTSVTSISAVQGKVTSNGKMNVQSLMNK